LRKRADVLTGRRVAQYFAADGGRRTIERSGHGPNAQSLGLKACNCDSLFVLELLITLEFGHLDTLEDLRCCTSGLNSPLDLDLFYIEDRDTFQM